jgi:nucleotide-binding universal stress UspA family protein
MITKILAAYDGSEPAGHAYRLALDLAKRYGADLLVLAVASPPEPPEDIETAAVLENAEAHYKELFDALKAEAAKEGLEPRLDSSSTVLAEAQGQTSWKSMVGLWKSQKRSATSMA